MEPTRPISTEAQLNDENPVECFARIIIPITRSRGTSAYLGTADGLNAPLDWSKGSVIAVMGKESLYVEGQGVMLAVCFDMVGLLPE